MSASAPVVQSLTVATTSVSTTTSASPGPLPRTPIRRCRIAGAVTTPWRGGARCAAAAPGPRNPLDRAARRPTLSPRGRVPASCPHHNRVPARRRHHSPVMAPRPYRWELGGRPPVAGVRTFRSAR